MVECLRLRNGLDLRLRAHPTMLAIAQPTRPKLTHQNPQIICVDLFALDAFIVLVFVDLAFIVLVLNRSHQQLFKITLSLSIGMTYRMHLACWISPCAAMACI